MRSPDRTEERRRRESGNGAELRSLTVVSDSKSAALSLRCCGREFPAENLAEIVLLLLDSPQLQVDAASWFDNQGQLYLALIDSHSCHTDCGSTAEIERTRQAQKQRSLQHVILLC